MKISCIVSIALFVLSLVSVVAQPMKDESWKTQFRATPEKINDMVHVRLDAQFNYQKSQLQGKVWITLQPHFYATDSVLLDAKGMDIHKVQLVEGKKTLPLKYVYDSLFLNIRLGKSFAVAKPYTLYIEYTARPNDVKVRGSRAINDAKGLYFIDPLDTVPDKPTQIWTQGETEGNSVWIPCIDRPNQKSTTEMYLTVPDAYVSLSNGLLEKQIKNGNGTHTDIWKMNQPIAPYLFFMGIGDFAIVKDSYKGKPVEYFVEKSYESLARKIFGETPEMMRFFSEKLGVDYPWVKYDQMTARDFVSGAMENATATLHGQWAQQNARELTDGNRWETTIAHELFHQWFGDYVTCESWSNLTVNESFADFSEGMWQEYRHGKDEGEATFYQARSGYLYNEEDTVKSLVRYYYADKEDMFDMVSYQKGGSILNMLRYFVGEDAFYKSLNTYLTRNSFGTGNARKLQQAFEDITGKDLNWFFNQWYFGAGHPRLDISYGYNVKEQQAMVYVKQLQTAQQFKLPVKIDVYQGSVKKTYVRWIQNAADTFRFEAKQKPDLINVDADKVLLAQKDDHKTLEEYIYQYQHAGNYVDRSEAIDFAVKNLKDQKAADFLQTAIGDSNDRIRQRILNALSQVDLNDQVILKIENIARTDAKKSVKAAAISLLAHKDPVKYKSLLLANLTDSSYTVAGTAYYQLIDNDPEAAIEWLPKLRTDAKGMLKQAINKADILTKTDKDFEEVFQTIVNKGLGQKYQNIPLFIIFLRQVNDVANFKKGLEQILKVRDELLPYVPTYKDYISSELAKLKTIKEEKKSKGVLPEAMDEQIKALEEVLK